MRYFAGKRNRQRHIFTCLGSLVSALTSLISIFVKNCNFIFLQEIIKIAKKYFNGTVVKISKQKIIFLLFTTVIFGKFK
jgi:hypothetical protein